MLKGKTHTLKDNRQMLFETNLEEVVAKKRVQKSFRNFTFLCQRKYWLDDYSLTPAIQF